MALTFSHAVGYRGYCSLNSTSILCTGGNINLTQEPIMGSGVWGAGYANATQIAYAWNYLQLEGSANFQLTTGGVWDALKTACFTDRTTAADITLKPDGKNGFSGNGWCSSLSFEASEGSAINGSFNFKGDPSGNNITADGSGDTSAKGMTNGNPGFAGATLIPYWQTKVKANEIDEKDIISWSCSYNSDIQMLKCCNLESTAPLSADYILLGDMTGDCSYTVFTLKGNFNPSSYHQEKKNLTFYVGNENTYIKIPLAIINSASTSMATGASYITAGYSFTALGDGDNPIMDMASPSSSGEGDEPTAG